MFIFYAFDRSTSSGDLFKIPLLLSRPITTVNKVMIKKMATTGKKLTAVRHIKSVFRQKPAGANGNNNTG
jgi:hypothetical protein